MTSDRSGGATAAGGDPDDRRDESTGYETTDYGRRDTSLPLREEIVEPRQTQVRQENVVHREEVRPVYREPSNDDRGPVNVAVGAERKDGVRWGPIWAGLLTALTTFILLELLFYSLGWLTLDPGEEDSGNSTAIVTGILALVAFFLGGLIAGATALWKGLFSGLFARVPCLGPRGGVVHRLDLLRRQRTAGQLRRPHQPAGSGPAAGAVHSRGDWLGGRADQERGEGCRRTSVLGPLPTAGRRHARWPHRVEDLAPPGRQRSRHGAPAYVIHRPPQPKPTQEASRRYGIRADHRIQDVTDQ